MTKSFNKITDMVVGLVVIAAILPVGLYALATANTTGWTGAMIAVFGIIGILAIVGVVKYIV